MKKEVRTVKTQPLVCVQEKAERASMEDRRCRAGLYTGVSCSIGGEHQNIQFPIRPIGAVLERVCVEWWSSKLASTVE